ncbi:MULTISPECIES: ankyrin repeat domain-containing protein [Candidatus Cardinium]|uniref:ankyrin repeat domain-containing protein n=1 Tax=Candidatus Cardinium TaxID=273135 RepID=UPI001FAADBBF|nr:MULTISPECIES: ankyrin repeat domain-containing protein [Cardinium]
MKKYTSYKVGLFISLLGFGTLTSCVSNTLPSYANNRRLGSGYSCYGLQKGCERHKGKIFIGAGLGLTASTIIALICYYGKALSTSLFTTGTCLVIVTPAGENIMLPKWNIAANKEHQIEELTRSVYKAIESGTQKWDKADSSLIDQFTQDINDTMTKFIGKQKLKYTNNFAVPYTISDPKVLDEETLENIDEETLENIKEARCDLDLIKCLINKGVDPNAKNSEGSSLLTPAVIYNNKDALKFLYRRKESQC